jgi:hypothetical protein
VEQRPAERESLSHAAGERRCALVPHVPEAVPLEQHPDSLATFRNAVEPSEQLEVLERRELAVNERLVSEQTDLGAIDADLQLPSARRREPGEQAKQRRLARAVRPRDDEEVAVRHLEVERRQHALGAEPLGKAAGADHAFESSPTRLQIRARRRSAQPVSVLLMTHGMTTRRTTAATITAITPRRRKNGLSVSDDT